MTRYKYRFLFLDYEELVFDLAESATVYQGTFCIPCDDDRENGLRHVIHIPITALKRVDTQEYNV